MAYRLSFVRKTIQSSFSRDITRNSEALPLICVSCASIRNASTSFLVLKTTRQLLSTKNCVPSLIQVCEKRNWRNPTNKSTATEYESDSDSDDEEFLNKEKAKTAGVKVVQVQIDNLRVDAVIKHAFGIARNKSEVLFYENRIRINGKRPTKKSVDTKIGDEIDIIAGISRDNEKFITVSRIEILKVRPSGDYLALTIRKQKNMTIENYEKDPWIEKVPEESENENKENELA